MKTPAFSKFLYIPAIALACSFVIGGYIYHHTLHNWVTDIVSQYMFSIVRDVQYEVEAQKLHFNDLTPAEVDDFLDSLSQSTTDNRFTIIDSSGVVLGDSTLKPHQVRNMENHAERHEVAAAFATGTGVAERYSSTKKQTLLYVAVRVEIIDAQHQHHADEHGSQYVIRMAMPMTALADMSADLKAILYLIMAFSMAVLVASIWYSYQRMSILINHEKQQQQDRINKSTKEIELLRQLANMLAACKNMDDARVVVQDIVPRILVGINGCVSIMRDSRNLLEVTIDWGDNWPAHTAFEPNDCWAMRKGKYHLSQDENHNLSCNHMRELNEQHTAMCIPLTAHGNTVGLFHLYFPTGAVCLTEETKQLAFTLAEHLGLALANLRFQQKLRAQALRDPLTQLYNRRYFEDKLEREWAIANQNNSVLSVLMLDLDHFKQFNDNFGHDAGDYVLKQVASLLIKVAGTQGSVCRLGGEELAIICPDFSAQQAFELAERVVAEVSAMHIEMNKLSLGQVSISAGVATYPDSKVSQQELVKLADTALYQAKDNGRSQAVHASASNTKASTSES
ncbi:diguanylate cyclase [Shewanella sp. WXL01]|uniref:diguanylate cyclase n=1 Tax=Shewanella maritima TaxID=2520507 RepID=A0A411PHC4_9GAMM|nr:MULTISPECIES: sensor domain-containing diguanylate cyclase [Shewanella]NKF48991.1 diguanylate cyclase [Shewanella sp. WXL01]QBF82864.1 diguanylate cyclase [Shewanella maritima]